MLILCWSNVLLFPGPIDLLTSFTVFKSRSFMEGHFLHMDTSNKNTKIRCANHSKPISEWIPPATSTSTRYPHVSHNVCWFSVPINIKFGDILLEPHSICIHITSHHNGWVSSNTKFHSAIPETVILNFAVCVFTFAGSMISMLKFTFSEFSSIGELTSCFSFCGVQFFAESLANLSPLWSWLPRRLSL